MSCVRSRLCLIGCAMGIVAACSDGATIVIPDFANYRSWQHIETRGDTPGHGDSIRRIYFNATAAEWPGFQPYFEETALVKEVYSTSGELGVIEIMYRDPAITDEQLRLDGNYFDKQWGWRFGATSSPTGTIEEDDNFCWRRCHANAPIAGAFFDYGALQ